jgi:hypothetical protein
VVQPPLLGAALMPLPTRSTGLRCALAAWNKYLAEINKHEAAAQHLRGDRYSHAPRLAPRCGRVQQEVDQEKK